MGKGEMLGANFALLTWCKTTTSLPTPFHFFLFFFSNRKNKVQAYEFQEIEYTLVVIPCTMCKA